MPEKSPAIHEFLDDFVGGLARTMTRLAFNSEQDRRLSVLGVLESCPKLEAMGRKDPVIVISRGNQRCRIGNSFFHIMNWGIAF